MFAHHFQPRARQCAQRLGKHQHARAGRRTAPHPAAQLVQLCQTHPLGVLNHHQAGIGHVHAHFNHRGRHQNMQPAGNKFCHHRRFFGRLHAPMHQTDRQPGQSSLQPRQRVSGRLQLQRLAFLNQRANPIGLLPFLTGVQHKTLHIVAAHLINQQRFNRRAVRRQLVNGRHVQIGIKTHGQRARNRRGRHHQLVHFVPFVFQCQPLRHAEAVLLIHNHQTELPERHIVLKQRVRSHRHAYPAVCQRGFGLLFFLFLQTAGQPRHRQPQRLQPLAEFHEMLFCQNFGGRHNRHLHFFRAFQCG